MQRSRLIFEALTAPGSEAERWARIEKLIDEREAESLWLDFKDVGPTTDPAYIKDKLARALSGFANTEGGTLIYGIEAKGGKEGVADAAEKIVKIQDASAFRATLEKYASAVVDPVIGRRRRHRDPVAGLRQRRRPRPRP